MCIRTSFGAFDRKLSLRTPYACHGMGQSSSQLLTNLKTRMDAIKAAAKNMPDAERRTLWGDWRATDDNWKEPNGCD
jgi:hypothetical protein